uniref:Uncharacterized protein n=1 Tax=Oryza sativa subsp. japonica TaxID=39947 RepID=Q6Z7H5_ORYSJ|nr:hypothetical protein [Oryza sativa Japonica Group]BAD17158.1 hypothetical protein [Oryza sativa Japonica Group]
MRQKQQAATRPREMEIGAGGGAPKSTLEMHPTSQTASPTIRCHWSVPCKQLTSKRERRDLELRPEIAATRERERAASGGNGGSPAEATGSRRSRRLSSSPSSTKLRRRGWSYSSPLRPPPERERAGVGGDDGVTEKAREDATRLSPLAVGHRSDFEEPIQGYPPFRAEFLYSTLEVAHIVDSLRTIAVQSTQNHASLCHIG